MTVSLAEFLIRYQRDDNEWWRLATGDMQNLFEEACDRHDRLVTAFLHTKNLHHEAIESARRIVARAEGHSFRLHEHVLRTTLEQMARALVDIDETMRQEIVGD